MYDKNISTEDIAVGFMGVWSVVRSLEGIMSDWLDLSEHQHPNCYLGLGQMTGVGPLRIVVAVLLRVVDFSFSMDMPEDLSITYFHMKYAYLNPCHMIGVGYLSIVVEIVAVEY